MSSAKVGVQVAFPSSCSPSSCSFWASFRIFDLRGLGFLSHPYELGKGRRSGAVPVIVLYLMSLTEKV